GKRLDRRGSFLHGVALHSGLNTPSLRLEESNANLTPIFYIERDIPHDHRATLQTTISNIEINARRPLAKGYGAVMSFVQCLRRVEPSYRRNCSAAQSRYSVFMENRMYRGILIAIGLMLPISPALADGEYVSDRVDGFFKYCYYSDGGALTVGPSNQCPVTNRGLGGQVDVQDTYPPGKLASEELRGKHKYCHYYGGASVPILPNDICPATNN
ncbi:hypothetical protein, partial [Aestuariivirga sp.]|uniref:hypothetical protein n=1 Tax=Aestuariivirga sp. TaxID=2650926 RepID=UPI0035936EAD